MNEEYLTFAKELALKAGDIMMKHFHVDVASHEKNDKSLVTIADEEINDMVITEVEARYPNISVYGEERSTAKKSDLVWVCDPIDGTVPYAKGIPVSVFSLALVDDGKPIVGVIYDPFMKRLYHATDGTGAYLNDEPISVSKKHLDYKSLINVEWWPEAKYDIDTPMHQLSLESKAYVLHLGSIVQAGCLVASGLYEANIFAGTVGKAMDIAALKVIVEEAGGKVTDIAGNDQRYDGDINGAIVSNGIVHQGIADSLKRFVSI